jgi:hypothetical protein
MAEEVNHGQRAHAKLSASGSAKWLGCPASVGMEAGYKDSTSVFAQEGTAAHEVADLCLQNNRNAAFYIGETIEKNEVDEDMAGYVQEYLDYVRSFKGILFPEQRVDFSNFIPEGFGTSDAIVIDEKAKTVHVHDLKYGKGIEVSAIDNTQGMLYAIGVMNDYGYIYDIETVVIHIIQPRKWNFSQWEIPVSDLMLWANWAKERAELSLTKDAPFNPSEKSCQWCKAKGDCSVLAKFSHDLITADFDDLDGAELTNPDKLTNDQLSSILSHKKLITDWLGAVESSIISKFERGESLPGFKMVAGRSTRKWNSDAEVILTHELKDKAFNKKLIGIGEAEKLLTKKKLAELDITDKPEGKPTLVPEADKRVALSQTIDDFDDLA